MVRGILALHVSLRPLSRSAEFHPYFNHLSSGILVPSGDICVSLGVHRETPVARQHHSIICGVPPDPGHRVANVKAGLLRDSAYILQWVAIHPTLESIIISVGVPLTTYTPLNLAFPLH